jgi:hypothetical protein
LRITGGEPLMSAETWKLIEWFKTNKGKSKTRLAINSNLGFQVDVQRLIESVDGLEIDLYTSNESDDRQAEYIRDGLDYSLWLENVMTLARSGKFRGLHVMCTINALCLDSLPQFLDTMIDLKKEYGRDYPNFSLNILRFPSFQSPLVLPDNIRTQYKNRLIGWMMHHQDSEFLHQHERNQMQRLIDYLDVVKTPHVGAAEQSVLQQDFKKFFTQYDQRRGKNLVETFPALADWYNTL